MRHGNVICLTEGKNINARSKSAVREGILENSETVKEDGSAKAAEGLQTWDERQIWTTDTAVRIFQTEDRNRAGELTVQSESQDKVIAPGTSGAYTFFLQNTGKTKMDYKVWLKAGWDMEALKSPLELRLAGERGWLLGSQDGWSSPEQMDRFLQEGSLFSGEKKKYILYWRWAYERGKDEEDTFFGNKAEDTLHTIVIHTEAAQSISGKFKEISRAIVMAGRYSKDMEFCENSRSHVTWKLAYSINIYRICYHHVLNPYVVSKEAQL